MTDDAAEDEVVELCLRAHPDRHHQHRRPRHGRPASGRRPSTSRPSSPRSGTRPSWSSRARRGATTCSAGCRVPTRSGARCSCTATSTSCRPTRAEWSVHPFSGAVQDGYVWGRGAVDMKDMVAMTIAVARRFKRDGVVPPRDIVFAFLADEEAGGRYGAQWLVEHRPDLFEGCTEAVGEVGGFSLTLAEDQRVYLDRGRREGHRLDAAAGPRQARPRLVPARRQRRDEGGRGGRPAGQPHVPAGPHRHRPRVPRRR